MFFLLLGRGIHHANQTETALQLSRLPGVSVEPRYCVAHQKLIEARYNRYQRDPATGKRYSGEWRKIRGRYIKAHPLCEMCKKGGKLAPAEEVHHIIPLSKGGTHAASNLMSLCTSCHSTITAREGGRWGR